MPVCSFATPIYRHFILALISSLFLFGCATNENSLNNGNSNSVDRTNSVAEQPESDKGLPKWMQDALARESNTPFKPTPYSLDDIGVNLMLPGKPQGKLLDTGTSKYIRFDIDAGQTMGCEVYYEEFDPAFSITRLAEINLKETSEKIGKVNSKFLYFTDSGAYESHPYHALEWIANLGSGSKRKLALLKYRLAIIGDFGLVCQHPEVGYQKTFENAFKFLVENFEYKNSVNPPYRVEVASASINNKVIGFYLEKYTEDDDGDTIVSIVSSMLVPNTNQSLTAIDRHTLTFSTPQGEVINSYKSSVENGELEYELALDFDNDRDKWIVSGEFKGKEFEHTLEHDAYLDSSLGQRMVLQQLVESDDSISDQLYFWDPNLDPATVNRSTLTLNKRTGEERTATHNMGPVEVNSIVDSKGSIRQSSVEMGSQLVVIKRLWLGRE